MKKEFYENQLFGKEQPLELLTEHYTELQDKEPKDSFPEPKVYQSVSEE